jgi:beta-glucosidase
MSDLLAMELALEQSDAGSVMCSYNRVNGPTPARTATC